MPTSPTPRAALYARVSTHHGQDVGLQLDALREVAAARGWVVVEEFVDEGVSGSKQRRPALDALMASARAGEIGELADGIAARIYLPELSRFVSADTITPDMVWEANAFTYVRNNPLKYVDPDGHSVWIKAGKILWKLAKGGGKGLDLALTFKGIIDDWSTLTNPSLPFSDHLIAGLSLSSEILPLSVDDLRWLDEIADAGQLKKVFGGGDAMAKQSLKKSASAAEGTGKQAVKSGDEVADAGAVGAKQTGGRMLGPDDWESADSAYDSIRITDDVGTIAANTGIRESRIARIKDHLFFKDHELDAGVARFDSDPFIANAWHRLQNNTHTPGDLRLLQHELFESRFEGIFKTDYRSAHNAAESSGRVWEWTP